MIFSKWNPEKIWHKNLTDCPPRLSDVATVPWEIKKVIIFNSIIHTYFSLFTLSHKKTIYNPLAHPAWKDTKNIKIGQFLSELIEKDKKVDFLGTQGESH